MFGVRRSAQIDGWIGSRMRCVIATLHAGARFRRGGAASWVAAPDGPLPERATLDLVVCALGSQAAGCLRASHTRPKLNMLIPKSIVAPFADVSSAKDTAWQ